MAAVTICSDFGAQKNKVWHCFHCFPICSPWSDRTRCHDLKFSECWALSQLFLSSLSLSSRGFLVPLHFLPSFCPLHFLVWASLLFLAFPIHPPTPSSSLSFSLKPRDKAEKETLVCRSHLSEKQNCLSEWSIYFWLISLLILGLFMKFCLNVLNKTGCFLLLYFICER